MLTYKVIASSSLGNCVVIDNVMVDCGISFKKINESCDLSKIDILLITHKHQDHLKIPTIKKIIESNRRIKILCNSEVAEILREYNLNHILVPLNTTIGIKRKNGVIVNLTPVKLYHDVETYGYRIEFKDFLDSIKVFYATDSHTLEGITAKDYDYYFLETNYSEENIESFDKNRVIGTHLSRQQAECFFVSMKKDDSVMISLHKSSRNY